MTIRLRQAIVMILQLDDAEVREAFNLTVSYPNKQFVDLTGDELAMHRLEENLAFRAYGGGWDQPPSWYRSAQVAHTKVKELLHDPT